MIIIPISIINHLRNEMVEKLNEKRSVINVRNGKQKVDFKDIKIYKEEFSYTYKVSNSEQYDIVSKYAMDSNIYFNKKECIYPYFRVSNGLLKPKNHMVLINELNDINNDKYMIANTYLNTTNIYALYTLYSLGFKRVTLSLEMGFERIKNLIRNYEKEFGYTPNIEVIVYGKIDLMITKYCVINKVLTRENIGCNTCKEDTFYLVDRKGYKLEVIKEGICNNRILNPKKLHLIEFCEELKELGVSKLRLEFTSETGEEVEEVVNGYNDGDLSLLGVTYGYFK